MANGGDTARSRKKSSRFNNYNHPLLSETIIHQAAQALGRGFDVTTDFRLGLVKGEIGSHLVDIGLDEAHTQDLITPTGLIIHNVSKDIRLDKGERTRFKSDVLSFNQMSERFNHGASIVGKMPLGLFNTMYGFNGAWQTDANATKSLALDGWFLTLYSLTLLKSPLLLIDEVKLAVPNIWEPKALARFIKKYGTHIIVGLKVGGKNVIYVRQHHKSALELTEVATLTQMYADQRFETQPDSPAIFEMTQRVGREKVSPSYAVTNARHLYHTAPTYNTTRMKLKDDIEIICRRRGGDDTVENHYEWMATVADSPDVIAMSFVPINSILHGISGVGFLSHAINLYLCYRPPIEELENFLEFQLPKQWSPVNELQLRSSRKEPVFPAMQFSLMGPRLYVRTSQGFVTRRPVTGLRLCLEGKKCNRLAIHLQHFTSLPKVLQPHWNIHVSVGPSVWKEPEERDSRWIEPVHWKSFSHVSTCPVEFSESWIGEAIGAFVVTGAQLQVWDFGAKKKVLFMRLLYTKVPGCSIRRSHWDHTPASAGKSGFLYNLGLSGPVQKPGKSPDNFAPINQNSAISEFPPVPKNPAAKSKLLKFVDISEMSKGPQDMPGHWLVSGAKLDVETGKIALRVKYSLLHYEGGPSGS